MSNRGLDFIEGSSFANAMNSIVEASLEEKRRAQLDRIVSGYEQQIKELNDGIVEGNANLRRAESLIFAERGIVAVTDEEVLAAEAGTLPEKRLSGNKTMREGVRKELQRLSQLDRDLAMGGGRFSRSAKDLLRNRLRSRIEEFIEYGVEHQMSFLTEGRLKPEHVKEFWDLAERDGSKCPGDSLSCEILTLQRSMNMLYVESTPSQDEFKAVNLIVAMGMTVDDLADKAGIKRFECPYANPPSDFEVDHDNDVLVPAGR